MDLGNAGRYTVTARGRARPEGSDYNSIITERGIDEERDVMG